MKQKEIVDIQGLFDADIMSSTIDVVTRKLLKHRVAPSVITKTKLVITELIQNIFQHGVLDGTTSSRFEFELSDETISMRCENLAITDKLERLQHKVIELSDLSIEQIRDKYKQELAKAVVNPNNTAGLGILSVFLRCNKHLVIKFVPENKNVQFVKLETKISL